MASRFDESKHRRTSSGQFTFNPGGRDHVPTTSSVTSGHQPMAAAGAPGRFADALSRLAPARSAAREELTRALVDVGMSHEQRQELFTRLDGVLTPTDTLPVQTPTWVVTGDAATAALCAGMVSTYEGLADGVDARFRDQEAAHVADEVTFDMPAARDAVRAFVSQGTVTTSRKADQGHLEAVALSTGGPLFHPFRIRVTPDQRLLPGEPVTLADVKALLDRSGRDRTLRSLDDVVTASYLTHRMSLASGAWRIDTEAVTADIIRDARSMEPHVVYEALALVYSHGRHQAPGTFTPAPGETGVPPTVTDWLTRHGYTSSPFGWWAMNSSPSPVSSRA